MKIDTTKNFEIFEEILHSSGEESRESSKEIISLTSAVDVDLHQVIHKKIYLWQRADFDNIRAIANNLSEEFLNDFDSDTPIGQSLRLFVRSVLTKSPSPN